MVSLLTPDFTTLDAVALGWLLLVWLGYGPAMQALRPAGSITAHMWGVRRAWAHTMLGRDNRITDASLIGHTVHSTTFFASTTMVALAALIGMLGALDHVHAALAGLGFAAPSTRAFLALKLLLLVVIMAHGFLKLTWTLRQLNYCLALMGAAPLKPDAAQRDRVAACLATALSVALATFNAGIRSYYVALAALAWLLGPGAMAALITGMLAMLLWRQFGSPTAAALAQCHAALVEERSPATLPAAGLALGARA